MSIPDKNSVYCDRCDCYNIDRAGKVYCECCIKEMKEEIIRKIELLVYNKPLDSEMRIVNMIANSTIKIIKEVLEK